MFSAGFLIYSLGHIKHLRKAKEFGDKLVVTISNIYVNKGRDVFNQNLEAGQFAALTP